MADVKKRVYGEKNRFKVGSSTRDSSTASGTQAVTGVGFQPKVIYLFSTEDGATAMSLGVSDGSSHHVAIDAHIKGADKWTRDTSHCILIWDSGSAWNEASINSFDSDGFTIQWAKTGSPSGTITTIYLALR